MILHKTTMSMELVGVCLLKFKNSDYEPSSLRRRDHGTTRTDVHNDSQEWLECCL